MTITVAPRVRDRRRRERPTGRAMGHRARTALVVALALAVPGALIATALSNSLSSRSAEARRAQTHAAEKAAIAAAFGYPYPLRCLTVTVSGTDPDYARAEVDRTNGCGRYHGYVDATFHRVGGTWRLVLDEGQLFVPNRLLLRPARAGLRVRGKARHRAAGVVRSGGPG